MSQEELGSSYIEYLGRYGSTLFGLKALVRGITYNEIKDAYLISNLENSKKIRHHAFVLFESIHNISVVRGGFTSGYEGTGPFGLSQAILLLGQHGINLEEIRVDEETFERLNFALLNPGEIMKIIEGDSIYPSQFYYDYVLLEAEKRSLQSLYFSKIPFGIVDPRIMDLALHLEKEYEVSLMTGYKRLEDIIRKKSGVTEESGLKLFNKVFNQTNPFLGWENLHNQEVAGRLDLFKGVFATYRNRRAHREFDSTQEEVVREFLMLNELYRLESSAVYVKNDESDLLS